MEQLEILLLLRSDAARWWRVEDVAEELTTRSASVARRLLDLRGHGLVTDATDEDGDPGRFRYRPATRDLEESVTTLATVYATRRSSVIGLIFADPDRSLRTFADAFRLREERDDG